MIVQEDEIAKVVAEAEQADHKAKKNRKTKLQPRYVMPQLVFMHTNAVHAYSHWHNGVAKSNCCT